MRLAEDADVIVPAKRGNAAVIRMLIDSLNSGGAQKQFVFLASQIKASGLEVECATYHGHDYFLDELKSHQIKVVSFEGKSKLNRACRISRWLRQGDTTLSIGFLATPSLLCEIARFPWPVCPTIVSERNTTMSLSLNERLRLFAHRFANAIVCNSRSQQSFIESRCSGLKEKLHFIRNCVDLDRFKPGPVGVGESKKIRVVTLAHYRAQKNPELLLEYCRRFGVDAAKFSFRWYGDSAAEGLGLATGALYKKLCKDSQSLGVGIDLQFLTRSRDVREQLSRADVFLLPSLYEGTSNAICEALASGVPVIASRVADNSVLVEDGMTGFLFDPASVSDFRDALEKFACLSSNQRLEMRLRCREFAEHSLSVSRFASEWLSLIDSVSYRSKLAGRPFVRE